ncbi:MAG: gamma-glutamylcyclotransferase family protein [Cyanobacteria bacterium P01_H01_bin.105]
METIDVFVYGTLKPGGTYYQQYCVPYLKTARPAQVRGLLYDLPTLGYPTMTLGAGWVKGYWFILDAAAMPELDYLEGYHPEGYETLEGDNDFEEEYVRQRTTVFDLNGQPTGEAWIYVMAQPPEGAIWLAEGEWSQGLSV